MMSIRRWRSIPACLALASLAICAIAQQPASRPTRRRALARPARMGGSVGKPAPDFELPVLVEERNARGEKVNRITDRKVRLSSFRGQQIVCVFFSSYT
jgi:hypothetical protein